MSRCAWCFSLIKEELRNLLETMLSLSEKKERIEKLHQNSLKLRKSDVFFSDSVCLDSTSLKVGRIWQEPQPQGSPNMQFCKQAQLQSVISPRFIGASGMKQHLLLAATAHNGCFRCFRIGAPQKKHHPFKYRGSKKKRIYEKRHKKTLGYDYRTQNSLDAQKWTYQFAWIFCGSQTAPLNLESPRMRAEECIVESSLRLVRKSRAK